MRIIAGLYKGYSLKPPKSIRTRPTSDRARETIFNILNNYIESYDLLEVLDVFSGTGALGLEALSRGALSATFIEIDREAGRVLYENINHLKVEERSKVLRLDATRLPAAHKIFNLIFMDAPYNKGLTIKSLLNLLQKGWISQNAIFVIETSSQEDLKIPISLKLLNERIIGLTKASFYKTS